MKKIVRINKALIALSLATTAFSGASADQNLIRSSINHPDRFESDKTRDAGRKPSEALEFFSPKPGDRILEVGAGGGYYTELLSRVVGEAGYVFAYNPFFFLPFVSEEQKNRFGRNKLKNVALGWGSLQRINLHENSFDAAYFINTYHDIYYQDSTGEDMSNAARLVLSEVRRLLKPGAVLAVVDHRAPAKTSRAQAASVHRITNQHLVSDFEDAGFTFIKSANFLENPNDNGTKGWFNDPDLKDATDRMVMLFRAPSQMARKK